MKAVSDTGPLLHLSEIQCQNALDIVQQLLVPPEMNLELRKRQVALDRIQVIGLTAKGKDRSKILVQEYSLDLGEAEAIALALQEQISLFLTDDLDARTTAKKYNLEVHGTLGILARAYREGIFSKEETFSKIDLLYNSSSLFITKGLVLDIKRTIEEFKK